MSIIYGKKRKKVWQFPLLYSYFSMNKFWCLLKTRTQEGKGLSIQFFRSCKLFIVLNGRLIWVHLEVKMFFVLFFYPINWMIVLQIYWTHRGISFNLYKLGLSWRLGCCCWQGNESNALNKSAVTAVRRPMNIFLPLSSLKHIRVIKRSTIWCNIMHSRCTRGAVCI